MSADEKPIDMAAFELGQRVIVIGHSVATRTGEITEVIENTNHAPNYEVHLDGDCKRVVTGSKDLVAVEDVEVM